MENDVQTEQHGQWVIGRHTCTHSRSGNSYWTVHRVLANGHWHHYNNKAGQPKRFRHEFTAQKAANELNGIV